MAQLSCWPQCLLWQPHPTPNIEWHRESSLPSAFDVRCSTFDVFARLRGFNARTKFGEISPHPMERGQCELTPFDLLPERFQVVAVQPHELDFFFPGDFTAALEPSAHFV